MVKPPPFALILILGAFASLSAMVLESMPASAANPRLALAEPSTSLAVPSTVEVPEGPIVTKRSPAIVSPTAEAPTPFPATPDIVDEPLIADPVAVDIQAAPETSVRTLPDGVARSLPQSLVGIPEFETDLLDRLNDARSEEGLTPLHRNEDLDAVALARAQNLVDLGYFDHYAPDGTSAFSELAARGLPYYLAGENLARNNYPPNRTVAAAYEGLMASPGHRANILEPRFGSIGVAAVRDGNVWLYVTVFTNPR